MPSIWWFKLLNIYSDMCVCTIWRFTHIDIVNSRFVSLLSPFWLLLMPPFFYLLLACLLAHPFVRLHSLFIWGLESYCFFSFDCMEFSWPIYHSSYQLVFFSLIFYPSFSWIVCVYVGCGSNLDVIRMN